MRPFPIILHDTNGDTIRSRWGRNKLAGENILAYVLFVPPLLIQLSLRGIKFL